MRKPHRIRRSAQIAVLVGGGMLFQTTGGCGSQFNEIAASLTTQLVSSVVTQFISQSVAAWLRVPSTTGLTT